MIFYSWPKIEKYSKGKVQIIKAIFQSIMNDNRNSMLRRTYDSIDFSGDSYLLKPEKLLWAFHETNQKDAANYLMLAGKRNYADFLIKGDSTLPLKHINIPIDTLKQNSLIDIQGTEIHFLLEK